MPIGEKSIPKIIEIKPTIFGKNESEIKNLLDKNTAFFWNPQTKSFESISQINAIDLNLIVCVERQKKTILDKIKGIAKTNITINPITGHPVVRTTLSDSLLDIKQDGFFFTNAYM